MEAGMTADLPANLKQLSVLLRQGEGKALEFKRSTSEMKEAMQTLCAFLNGSGGALLFGIRPDATADGQDVSDQTLRDIAQASDRFEPPAHFSIERIRVKTGREVIAVSVHSVPDAGPFTYESRPYERVGSTTRKMPQAKYERRLLERAHSKHRWENEPAEGVSVKDIDRAEVFRFVEASRSVGRLVGPAGNQLADVLGRLNVTRDGKVLQASVVLFGKQFMPDYPQCELRLARFRGVDNAEFIDQRQMRAPAFKLLEDAQLFCERHFPLAGRIIPGRLQRVDTPLIPPDAMREILVNALIHRDYSVAGGAVSLAIYDDRVEIWSAGKYPEGITADMLDKRHPSIQRNPIIADVFHRAGLIEKWGRGTNRVSEMCRAAGIPSPKYEEIGGSVVVTFKVKVGSTARVEAPLGRGNKVRVRSESGQSRRSESVPRDSRGPIEIRVLAALRRGPLNRHSLAARVGHRSVSGGLRKAISILLQNEWIEYTIPEKPNSRLQEYRLTLAGERALKERLGEEVR
jgi:ATP-dependent DNA helicase RecG